jgi:NitT/TauT family transport system permease protein
MNAMPLGRPARILAPLLFVAVVLAVWQGAVTALRVPAYFLPGPTAVAQAMAQNAPLLISSAWVTLRMALWALPIASLAAVGLAVLLALSRLAEVAVRPVAIVVQVTLVLAIAPLVSIWAGIDHPERAVVGLAAVAAFFPIFSGAMTGLKAADPDLERVFDLYGASRLQRLRRLWLPSAVPFLLEGHRVAAGLAIVGAVVSEFVSGTGASQGLAWRILEAGNRLQTAKVFAALFVLGLMGVAVHVAFQAFEAAVLRRWRGR